MQAAEAAIQKQLQQAAEAQSPPSADSEALRAELDGLAAESASLAAAHGLAGEDAADVMVAVEPAPAAGPAAAATAADSAPSNSLVGALDSGESPAAAASLLEEVGSSSLQRSARPTSSCAGEEAATEASAGAEAGAGAGCEQLEEEGGGESTASMEPQLPEAPLPAAPAGTGQAADEVEGLSPPEGLSPSNSQVSVGGSAQGEALGEGTGEHDGQASPAAAASGAETAAAGVEEEPSSPAAGPPPAAWAAGGEAPSPGGSAGDEGGGDSEAALAAGAAGAHSTDSQQAQQQQQEEEQEQGPPAAGAGSLAVEYDEGLLEHSSDEEVEGPGDLAPIYPPPTSRPGSAPSPKGATAAPPAAAEAAAESLPAFTPTAADGSAGQDDVDDLFSGLNLS